MWRKWLPTFPSQRLKFIHSIAQILEWKSNLQREENQLEYPEKNLGVRLRSIILSQCVEHRTQSGIMEVGGVTDDHYTNLTPIRYSLYSIITILTTYHSWFFKIINKHILTGGSRSSFPIVNQLRLVSRELDQHESSPVTCQHIMFIQFLTGSLN